jgi:predicted small lipoprotein YifL
VIVIVKPPVKLSPKLPRAAALLVVAIAAILSGCGQRGPLYLPGQPGAPTVPAKASPVPTDSNSSTSK